MYNPAREGQPHGLNEEAARRLELRHRQGGAHALPAQLRGVLQPAPRPRRAPAGVGRPQWRLAASLARLLRARRHRGRRPQPRPHRRPTRRIRLYQGGQQETTLLDRIARECAPEGFDVIIDDCSHVGELARVSFWHLFDNHLKPGGLYVIEDWGTGYWDFWPDGVRYRPRRPDGYSPLRHRLSRVARRLYNSRLGRLPLVGRLPSVAKRALQLGLYNSHDYGLVGFVKELVDEIGMDDITHPDFGISPRRPSRFREMKLSHSHLIIVKD